MDDKDKYCFFLPSCNIFLVVLGKIPSYKIYTTYTT